ncbi:lipase family protein [Corynebacterium sp. 335C]
MTELPRSPRNAGRTSRPARAARRGPRPSPTAVLPALLVPAMLAAACTATAGDEVEQAASQTGTKSSGAASPAAPAPGTVLESSSAQSVLPTSSESGMGDAADGAGDGDSSLPGAGSSGGAASRSEPLQVTPFTFASRDTHGEPMEVTAVRVTSEEGWTGEGPRPLLVVAPGTSGMADRCAPSKSALEGRMTDAAVEEFAGRGWTVVLTDYEGLGTPGTHTYMLRESQGHAVLDAARAGLALDGDGADRPVGISGYSQGGGAAASAAELAPSYAPELDLRGVVAGAVPANLAEVAGTIDGSVLSGAVGYNINGLVAAYPELEPQLDRLMNERGKRMLETVNDQCAAETMLRFKGRKTAMYSVDGRSLSEHLRENDGIRARVDEQRIGRLVPEAPVFMTHNVADDIVPFEQGRQLGRDWCAAGADVRFTSMNEDVGPLINHGLASRETRDGQWEFLESSVLGDGPSTPSDCGSF